MSKQTRPTGMPIKMIPFSLVVIGWLLLLTSWGGMGAFSSPWGLPIVLAMPAACVLYVAVGTGRRSAWWMSGLIALTWATAVIVTTVWAQTLCDCHSTPGEIGGPGFFALFWSWYYLGVALGALTGIWTGYLIMARTRLRNNVTH